MAVLEIKTLPKDEAILRQKAKRVTKIDDRIQRLIDDMIDTMRAAPGVGLAAPQVGVSLRVCVIEVPDHPVYALINPEIVKRSGERRVTEGCLSIPGYWAELTRSEKVTVKALGRDGKEFRIRNATGLLAQAIEHELDHLDGILYIDYLEHPETELMRVEDRADEEAAEEVRAQS
ncbi:MAG TPA: peptide deformylase [Dehalococcoidia bacterium]